MSTDISDWVPNDGADAIELGTLCCCEQAQANERQRFQQAIEDLDRAERELAEQVNGLAADAERDFLQAEQLRDRLEAQMRADAYFDRARAAGIVPTVEEAAALAWLMR